MEQFIFIKCKCFWKIRFGKVSSFKLSVDDLNLASIIFIAPIKFKSHFLATDWKNHDSFYAVTTPQLHKT